MEAIRLILPYPVSANRYWRTRAVKGVAMTYVSSEAKAYKSQVAIVAKLAGIIQPMQGRVAVSYILYPKRPLDWVKRATKQPNDWDDTVACLDLDNAQKVLLDSLKGVVFEDDKWVRQIDAIRAEPDGEARIVVMVRKIQPSPLPQGRLI